MGLDSEALDGIEVEDKGKEWLLRIWVKARGCRFVGSAVFQKAASLGVLQATADRVRLLCEDLNSFIYEFYFFGCGGPNHVFPGDPEWYEEATCPKCGVVKKLCLDHKRALASVQVAQPSENASEFASQ